MGEVLTPTLLAMSQHAPEDAPVHGAAPVVLEIDPGPSVEEREDLAQVLLVVLGGGSLGSRRVPAVPGELTAEPPELLGDLLRREDEVNVAGGDRGLRHVRVARGRAVLRHRDAAGLLDRLNPARTVGPRAGQNHADRAAPVHAGERAEERVDRQVRPPPSLPRDQPEMAVREGQRRVGRDDVGVVGLDAHAVLGGQHRDGGSASETRRASERDVCFVIMPSDIPENSRDARPRVE